MQSTIDPITSTQLDDAQTMKAIVHDTYGSPDVLELREIDKPQVGDDEILVRVTAAALHVGDSFMMRGAPFLVRMDTGLTRPKHGIPGLDFAGTVEATGKDVTHFKIGDEVYGSANGTSAEFAVATEKKLAHKPANLSFEEAAAIPTSGLAALHAMRDVARVQPGQKVLINGASGGVGSFAVQIAKARGAEVTGVCSTRNVEMVRSLGADRVIDYTRDDFTRGNERYDVILDNVENHPLKDIRRALTPGGTLVLNSGTGASGFKLLVRMIKPLLLSPFVRHKLKRYLSLPKGKDLIELKRLAEAGRLKPVVGRTFPLEQVPEAMRLIEAGHSVGKVVVRVEPAGATEA